MPITHIQPSQGFHIDRTLPGDKSISHRAAIIAAIAEGESVIQNLATGADVTSTLRCLMQLGVDIQISMGETRIIGKGLYGLEQPDRPLDCGNSGTTTRLLAGVLAGQRFDTMLTGDASLSRRPMKRIAEPLSQMGGRINLSESDTLPMEIIGSDLKGIDYTLEVASAQVKSCILFAGMYAQGETCIVEKIPTRDHTERLLPFIKKEFSKDNTKWIIQGGQQISPMDMTVPGDFSSAAFLMAAGVMTPNSEVTLRKVGLNPTRTGFLDTLQKMGVHFNIDNTVKNMQEPYGDITIRSHDEPLKGCKLQGSVIPNLIDEIPILAVLGTQTDSGLEIRNASELRKKECDRIKAIVYNLRQMGSEVIEYEDGFFIHPCELKAGSFKSFGDHRIAMAMVVAAMAAKGISTIDDTECITISFPDFFEYAGIETSRYLATKAPRHKENYGFQTSFRE